MIHATNLTKRYGAKTAVDGIDFTVMPTKVTGFLGPNGAGKSTTMRMILGLDRPTAGSVTVNGKPLKEHVAPIREVGALLDAKAIHPGRTARAHLRSIAATHRIPDRRVDEVIEMTGLNAVASKRVGGFSLGMGQRLGIAAALLGDPHTLILDEPVNGLDPDGVLWVRQLVRQLAKEGKTVLLSSHLMSEMAQTADQILVLGRGKILADEPIETFTAANSVRVRTPDAAVLLRALTGVAEHVSQADVSDPTLLTVVGAPAARIGELASYHSAVLHELTPLTASLEDQYMALTQEAVEYRSATRTR